MVDITLAPYVFAVVIATLLGAACEQTARQEAAGVVRRVKARRATSGDPKTNRKPEKKGNEKKVEKERKARLERLRRRIQAFRDSVKTAPGPQEEEKEFHAFARSFSKKDLAVAVSLAMEPGADKNHQWLIFLVLLDHQRFDDAVKVVLKMFTVRPDKNSRYRVGKIWHWRYSERKDYKQRTRKFGEAFARAFSKANKSERAIIASIFGLDKSAANYSADQFKRQFRLSRGLQGAFSEGWRGKK